MGQRMAALTGNQALIHFDQRRLAWVIRQDGRERGVFVHLHHAQAEASAWERTGRWS